MNIYEIEDKTERWIEENSFKWRLVLISVGIVLNIFQLYLFGHPTWITSGIGWGIGYGMIFILVDYLAHQKN